MGLLSFAQESVDIGGPAIGILVLVRRGGIGECLAHQLCPCFDVAASARQRVGGPLRLDGLIEHGVALACRRRGRPFLDGSARDALGDRIFDDIAQLDQKVGRTLGFESGLAPMVSRDEELLGRPGDRHIQQSPFLVDPASSQAVLVSRNGVGELFTVRDALGVQLRNPETIPQGGAVAAHQRGQLGGACQPGRRGHTRGKHPGAQMRDRHHIPFQTLGRMHGKNLYPARASRDFHRREAFFDLPCRIQVLQERGDHAHRVALVGGLRESGGHICERTQLVQATAALSRDELDVQCQHPLHLADQVSQWHAEPGTQCGQFPPQGSQARPALRRILFGSTGIADGIGQTRYVGILPRHVGAGTTESHRPPPQHGQVVGTKAPPRAGQYPQGSRTRGRVRDKTEHRHGVGDLRKAEQTRQSDHFDRNTVRGKDLSHGGGIAVAPDQHRRRRRTVPATTRLLVHGGQFCCDPFSFGDDIAEKRTGDVAGSSVRAGAQRPHRHRTPPRFLGHGIGQVQSLGRVTPTGAQLPCGRR